MVPVALMVPVVTCQRAPVFSWPFSVTHEAWINTTSTSGHKIQGFESSSTGTGASNFDGHLYVNLQAAKRWQAAIQAAMLLQSPAFRLMMALGTSSLTF